MVMRDRNHVSIFAWSIGNEVDYPNDPYSHAVLDGEGGFTQKTFGGYNKNAPNANRLGIIAERLANVIRKHDPSRPVTAGLAGVAMSNQTRYPSALDIVGYNYTENRYTSDHQKYPDRIIFGSENRHDLSAWQAVSENEHIFGQFLWTGIDYLGESGKWPSRGFYSGLIDFAGQIKPRGYFRQSLWSDTPMIYIGTYPINNSQKSNPEDVLSQTEQIGQKQIVKLSKDAWSQWNYKPTEMIRVVCYTNAAKTQLLLNGQELGEPKPYDPTTGIIYWDIPFKAGRLEAIGINEKGLPIARYAINTPGPVYKLHILDRENISFEHSNVCQINVQIVDENENIVQDATNEISCTIRGKAELLGLEAGNNQDMSDYTDNIQHAYRGKLTAYIKAIRPLEDTIQVEFSAKNLKPSQITIKQTNKNK